MVDKSGIRSKWKCQRSNRYSKQRGAFSRLKVYKGGSAWSSTTLCRKWISCFQRMVMKTKHDKSIIYQNIKLSSQRDRKVTLSQIQRLLSKEPKTPISESTVRRKLSCSGLRGVPVSKPLLRGHKAKHCGLRNTSFFTGDDWTKVLLSDESKFEICGSKRGV